MISVIACSTTVPPIGGEDAAQNGAPVFVFELVKVEDGIDVEQSTRSIYCL